MPITRGLDAPSGEKMRTRSAQTWHDAVRTALSGDDIEHALALVDDGWPTHVVSDPALVRATVQSLPSSVWQGRPWLLTALACSYQGSSYPVERATASVYFKEARRVLDSDQDVPAEQALMTRFCFVTHHRRRGRFALALSELDVITRGIQNSDSIRFEWRVGMDARIRLEHSMIDWHRSAYDGVESSIGPALALAETRMVPSERVTAYGTAALYALLSESYEQVEDWADRAAMAAGAAETEGDPSEIPLTDSVAIAPALFALAMSRLERGYFDEAAELIPRLERVSQGGEWRVYGTLLDAMRLLLVGKPAEALEPLRLSRQYAHRWTDARLVETLSYAVRLGIETALGRPHSSEILMDSSLDDSRHLFCTARYLGWLLVSEGRYVEAIDCVAECIRLGDRHARGSLTDVLLIEATALTAVGESDRGAASFDYALALCAESGFRRAFHHVPALALGSMLSAAAARAQTPASAALIDELVGVFGSEDLTLPRLSEREVEIIRILALGSSMRELSQNLYISPNTLKTHVRHIYRKLGVGSRDEAVRTAHRLGITPSSPLN